MGILLYIFYSLVNVPVPTLFHQLSVLLVGNSRFHEVRIYYLAGDELWPEWHNCGILEGFFVEGLVNDGLVRSGVKGQGCGFGR